MEPLPHEIAEKKASMASLPHETAEPIVSMADLPRDIQHKIFIGLRVTDLIRCKSVCKSWSSSISDPVFIKDHLNHQYYKDHKNERFRHRRITMSDYKLCEIRGRGIIDRQLLGSSNGLVCVALSPTEIVVINPSTREVKNVTEPKILETDYLCWGFGYDSIKDDYKVVVGFKKGENNTCFHVFSLRYNKWKVIGDTHYVFTSNIGILFNGGLHWLGYDTSTKTKNVILSFHFSDEKFKEVPMPDDVTHRELYTGQTLLMRLGTVDGYLCLFTHIFAFEIWIMIKERSWRKFGLGLGIKYDAVHMIKQLKNYIPHKKPLCRQGRSRNYWLCRNRTFFGTPIFVESLVSPHFHKKPQRKRQITIIFKRS
ncbi:F-box protein CPR1-like [Bidens hawaiensis]|uniref:F-box protein CPR1-like n=1 Tax=Bidens hawaiensis TaxID=980011 RepID=UPI00404A7ED5